MAEIQGTAGDDNLAGGAGNDLVQGLEGDDYLQGGAGNDTLEGGDGIDTLDGEEGNDSLIGGAGHRTGLAGGPGDDYLNASGADNAILLGGPGRDTLVGGMPGYAQDPTGVIVNLSAQAQTVGVLTLAPYTAIDGYGDEDVLELDVPENTYYRGQGSQFPDRWFGGEAPGNRIVYVSLLGGDDIARLGASSDYVNGGSGNDDLDAGAGRDFLDYSWEEVDVAGTARRGVVVDLTLGEAIDGWGDKDVIRNFEDVVGSNKSDTIRGDDGDNDFRGLDGDDVLIGRGGVDYLNGFVGADRLEGGADGDALVGDEWWQDVGASDTLLGGDGEDTLSGDPGNDLLVGGSGFDIVHYDFAPGPVQVDLGAGSARGAAGNDTIEGVEAVTLSQYDDVGAGSSLADRFSGRNGNDALSGRGGPDILRGDDGDDTLTGGGGNDTLVGGAGTDTAVFAGNRSGYRIYIDPIDPYSLRILDNNPADGNDGLDVLIDVRDGDILRFADVSLTLVRAAEVASNTVDLTREGAQLGIGGWGTESFLVGQAHDEVLSPSLPNPVVVESPVSWVLGDKLTGLVLTGTSSARGTGNAFGNSITGNAGPNLLFGKGGNDTLDGGPGNDTLDGGPENDTYIVDAAGDRVLETWNNGWDTVLSSVSWTLAANTEILRLEGDAAINGTGNPARNAIHGNSADNLLNGLGADDSLDGGDGDDTLFGGGGADTLTGGAGADVFVFDSPVSRGGPLETITDFTAGEDLLQLSAAAFPALAPGRLDPSQFQFAPIGYSTEANGEAIRIVVVWSGDLFYDADGSGPLEPLLFGRAASAPEKISAADFFIVT